MAGGKWDRGSSHGGRTPTKVKQKREFENDSTPSLEEKVARAGGKSGYALEGVDQEDVDSVKFGGGNQSRPGTSVSGRRIRKFGTPRSNASKTSDTDSVGTSISRLQTPHSWKPEPKKKAPQDNEAQGIKTPSGTESAFTLSSRTRRNPYMCSSSSVASVGSLASRRQKRDQHSTVSRIRAVAPKATGNATSHILCAISENLAKETCVASIDAGAPVSLLVTKQGNGQTYAETLAYLEMLAPDEILLNEGRRNSQLAEKVMSLYNVWVDPENPIDSGRNRKKKTQADGRAAGRDKRHFANSSQSIASCSGDLTNNSPDKRGACHTSTVVKFVPRSYFDQTRGAELLRRIVREGAYDASVVEEYILLSSSYAVLQYAQLCLGVAFSKKCLDLAVSSGGNNRMTIDRSTLMNLEMLVNAKTGKLQNSLIGTIDCTKTSVGARLLRTNLMAPPIRVDTINARLDLVGVFLDDEEFFYTTMEHLESLPDIDKMLSHVALVPRKGKLGGKGTSNMNEQAITANVASKGIGALVCIKSTLSVLPTFGRSLQDQLSMLESKEQNHRVTSNEPDLENDSNSLETEGKQPGIGEDSSTITDGSSLLIGLGSGPRSTSNTRHQLLRAILLTMKQPAFAEILSAVTEIFTESTTFSRNAHAMRHQECFALKPNTDGMMDVLRKAFLANVDDIYKLADEYAETYGLPVSVKETTTRGYYLSIPTDMGTDIPDVFIQPVKRGRFINCTTEEVHSLSSRAQENVQDLLIMTHSRIQEVIDVARSKYDALGSLSDAIALLDMCHCFADNVASSRLSWCRPFVTDNDEEHVQSSTESTTGERSSGSGALSIRNGRYAIDVSGSGLVNSESVSSGNEFIPNDTYASAMQNFTVITGINGSGKSTYLKQIAVSVVLAQCGSYIPAEEAFIPVRDRLCTRIGTADDQEHNISTFMLEMKETAFICRNATHRSLILMDELGRATSNEDGVAIAWAVSEFLLVKRAFTFFVTHYPQLSSLADVYPNVQNQHLGATISAERSGEIRYTHKIMPGPCIMSTDYGVEMAATCGWPADVVKEARLLRTHVQKKLPDSGALCRHHPSGNMNTVEVRKKAGNALQEISKHLVALKDSEGRLTNDAKRNYLQDLRDRLVPMDNDDVVIMIKRLLLDDDTLSKDRTQFQLISQTLESHAHNEPFTSTRSTKMASRSPPKDARAIPSPGIQTTSSSEIKHEIDQCDETSPLVLMECDSNSSRSSSEDSINAAIEKEEGQEIVDTSSKVDKNMVHPKEKGDGKLFEISQPPSEIKFDVIVDKLPTEQAICESMSCDSPSDSASSGATSSSSSSSSSSRSTSSKRRDDVSHRDGFGAETKIRATGNTKEDALSLSSSSSSASSSDCLSNRSPCTADLGGGAHVDTTSLAGSSNLSKYDLD